MPFAHEEGHPVTGANRDHKAIVFTLVGVFLSSFDIGNDVVGRGFPSLFSCLNDLRRWTTAFIWIFIVNQVPYHIDTWVVLSFHVLVSHQTVSPASL